MNKTGKYELRSQSKSMGPTMNIGKEGLTPATIEEVKTQLRRNKLIKIKVLKSFAETMDKKEVGKKLSEETNSVLIDNVGFVYVLADPSIVK